MVEEEARQAIQEAVDCFPDEDESILNSLRILVASCFLGPNADKIAKFLDLNRDKVVRPRAKRLRQNGIWTQDGKIALVCQDESTDEEVSLSLLLDAMVAEGLLVRKSP